MNIISYKDKTPKIGNNAVILNGSFIVGDVNIGEDSSIWFNSVIKGDIGYVKIGKQTNIQDMVSISSSVFKNNIFNVNIGNFVSVESKVTLRGCNIGNDCIIGLNTIIMDGVVIGENCIVMANSFLPKFRKYPPNSLISGNPAKIIRPLIKDEIDYIINNAKLYANLKNDYLQN